MQRQKGSKEEKTSVRKEREEKSGKTMSLCCLLIGMEMWKSKSTRGNGRKVSKEIVPGN
jgi:hypothetical protein